MSGRLYGISVGPGDPELMTLKAVRLLGQVDVIAVPKHSGEGRTALGIISGHIGGKPVLECAFAMSRDPDERTAARAAAAELVVAELADVRDVGFVTLGDATTYSTYMYLHELVVARGYEAVVVPGVTSFAAAAAELGVALASGDETLTVIPVGRSLDVEGLLDQPGNKVVMKSGPNLVEVLRRLAGQGRGAQVRVASRVTMPGQRLYGDAGEYLADPETGYLTLAIIKERA